MSDTSHDAPHDTPVVTSQWDGVRIKKKGVLHYTPTFAFLLLFFVVVKLLNVDMHAPLIGSGDYMLSAGALLTIFASGMAMLEMLKVSEPGINNIGEVISIIVIAVVYLIFFVVAAGGLYILGLIPPRVFANSEFLMLCLMAIIESVMALIINSRTMVRQVVDFR